MALIRKMIVTGVYVHWTVWFRRLGGSSFAPNELFLFSSAPIFSFVVLALGRTGPHENPLPVLRRPTASGALPGPRPKPQQTPLT